MSRNAFQGTGTRHGAPRSPVPAPSSSSTSEEAFDDVRQAIGSLKREMASMQRVIEIRGREISEYAKVRELDELHKTIESLRRRINVRDSEALGTPSHEENQPIPIYYGKRKDLSAFFTLFFNWARVSER